MHHCVCSLPPVVVCHRTLLPWVISVSRKMTMSRLCLLPAWGTTPRSWSRPPCRVTAGWRAETEASTSFTRGSAIQTVPPTRPFQRSRQMPSGKGITAVSIGYIVGYLCSWLSLYSWIFMLNISTKRFYCLVSPWNCFKATIVGFPPIWRLCECGDSNFIFEVREIWKKSGIFFKKVNEDMFIKNMKWFLSYL